MTRGHGAQGGERSYDGLAAADVALNEAVHGTVRGQIGEDLVRDAALGVREVEGKLRKEAADQFGVVARERRGGALKGHGARFAQRDLLGEEFVEDEPAPGGGGALLQTDDVGARGRRVDVGECFAKAGKAELRPDRLGHEVREVQIEQCAVDALAKPSLLDAFACGVDGRERLGQFGLGSLAGLDARMHHLEPAVVALARLAVEAHGAADGKLLLDGREVVEEADRDAARRILDDGLKLLTAARAHEALVCDAALDLGVRVHGERADGCDARLVLIAKREVKRKVPVAHESELLEPDVKGRELLLTDDARGALLLFRGGGHVLHIYKEGGLPYGLVTTASISTRAALGSAATAKQERAG